MLADSCEGAACAFLSLLCKAQWTSSCTCTAAVCRPDLDLPSDGHSWLWPFCGPRATGVMGSAHTHGAALCLEQVSVPALQMGLTGSSHGVVLKFYGKSVCVGFVGRKLVAQMWLRVPTGRR